MAGAGLKQRTRAYALRSIRLTKSLPNSPFVSIRNPQSLLLHCLDPHRP